MQTQLMVLVVSAAFASGCATVPPPLAPRFTGLVLVPSSSATVVVREPSVISEAGQPVLFGRVGKVFGSGTTENTHVDVVYLGTKGETLREETVAFVPRRLNHVRRSPARQGYYRVPLIGMPDGTARIDVRAHDGPHDPAAVSGRPSR